MTAGSQTTPASAGALVPFSDDLHHEVHQFLVEEAAILDERRYEDWLALLTGDVVYRMPVRVTTPGELGDTVLADMDHFHEDRYSLGKRVERLYTEHAWTEDPPSRVRHFVTNVRTFRVEDRDDEVIAKTYILLFRSRGDVREAEFVAAERTDRLRRDGDSWKIARRDILVDESVLRTQNLAIFL
ncbi:MAG: 3-phenylpropionate/cinnamic acid dioxygenase subunit beta [Nitriliruptorales bacterium]|nr:3-phenylpropionate/cinnamic acid dioxygenase subunit beta [Nitriliruptorales bacterium]